MWQALLSQFVGGIITKAFEIATFWLRHKFDTFDATPEKVKAIKWGATMVDPRGIGRTLKEGDFGDGKITAFNRSALPGDWSKVAAASMYRLNRFASFVPFPVHITSAARSPEHNKRIGGASRSKHLYAPPDGATALDVIIKDPNFFRQDRLKFYIGLARKVGFNGIGIYERYKNGKPVPLMHLDIRDKTAGWAGVLDSTGKKVFVSLQAGMSKLMRANGRTAVSFLSIALAGLLVWYLLKR